MREALRKASTVDGWMDGWMGGWVGGTLEFVGSPPLTHRGRPAAYQAHES